MRPEVEMIYSQTIRHLYRSHVYETDIWIGPYTAWGDWPEAHSPEWQPVWYRGLTFAARPVGDRAGVRPRADGYRAIDPDRRRFRLRFLLGGEPTFVEVVFRGPGEEPPASLEPAAWHRLDLGPVVAYICPLFPATPARPHADDAGALRGDVGVTDAAGP